MTQGFLAVPRWLQDEFEGEGELFGFYTMLAMKAWYSEGKKPLKEGGFLLRGQLLETERALAETWHRKGGEKGRAQVRRFLQRLTKRNRVELKTGPQKSPEKSPKNRRRATIITIIDYNELFYEGQVSENTKEPKDGPKVRPIKSPKVAQKEPTENKGTREQGNKDSPLSPPKGEPTSERKRRALATDQAEAFTAAAIGARRNCLGAPEAERMIGRDGWRLLMFKFGDWAGFARSYETATQRKPSGGSDQVPFEAQLKASFRALLLQAPADPRPVRLVPKDRAT